MLWPRFKAENLLTAVRRRNRVCLRNAVSRLVTWATSYIHWWYCKRPAVLQEDESRRLFVFRLLSVLVVDSNLGEEDIMCRALVHVAAAPSLVNQDPTGWFCTMPHSVLTYLALVFQRHILRLYVCIWMPILWESLLYISCTSSKKDV